MTRAPLAGLTEPDVVASPPSQPGAVYTWGPRPALDGIRAVAVYLVVVFHGGVGAFQGGFIGVDLFFALSGFLVTNMMLGDIATHGRLRLSRFYARRFRRLLPAAAVAVVGIAAASLLLLTPVERASLAGDARATLLYVANWHFIGSATDYLAAETAQASPYLHFWSLSIEEQFYFIFPWIIAGLIALRRRTGRANVLFAGLLLLTVASLASQLYWSGEDPLRAYYATDARLYQLLAGAALAVGFRRWGTPRRLRRAAGIAAPLALGAFIIAATSIIDVSPSVRGMLAIACAVALLATLELHTDSRTSVALSGGTITYLGRISYGTYLWHWPVIVFARHLGDFSAVELALLSAVIGTSLAALSNEIVELPIRTSAWLDRRPRQVIIVGLAVGLVLGLVYVPGLLARDRAPGVVSAGERTVVALPKDTRQGWGKVPDDIDWEALALRKAPEPPDCEGRPARDCIVVRGAGAHLHLVGDSHARMVLPTFTKIARDHDMTLSASYDQGCPWQKGLLLTNDPPKGMASCTAHHNDQYDRVIPKLDPDVVVVMSVARDDPHWLPRGKAHLGGTRGLSRATAQALRDLTVDGRRVVIVEPTPVWPFDPLSCLSAAERVADCAFKPTRSPLESELVYRYHALDTDIFSIELDSIACPQLPVCVPMGEGTVSFRDKTHFGATFARRIAGQVHKRFQRAGVFEDLPGS